MEKLNNQIKTTIIGIGDVGIKMLNRIIETTKNENISYISINSSEDLKEFTIIEVFKNEKKVKRENLSEYLKNVLKGKKIDVSFVVCALGGKSKVFLIPLLSSILRDLKIVSVGIMTRPFTEDEETIENKEFINNILDLIIFIPSAELRQETIKSLEQAYLDVNDSVRLSVQEALHYIYSLNNKDVKYERLKRMLRSEF